MYQEKSGNPAFSCFISVQCAVCKPERMVDDTITIFFEVRRSFQFIVFVARMKKAFCGVTQILVKKSITINFN
jgi:hypothetical protein